MLNKLFYKSLMILMIFISMNTLTFSKEVTITKDVSGFSSLLINSGGTVYLRQGNKDSVKIIIEKNLIPYLNVDNSFQELSLSVGINSPEASQVKYYITMREIKNLKSVNSVEIKILTPLSTNQLTLAVENSGLIDIDKISNTGVTTILLKNSGTINVNSLTSIDSKLEVKNSGQININNLSSEKVQSTISNSGQININSGKTSFQNVQINNSGNYQSEGMISKKGNLVIENSGNIHAHINKKVNIDISGSGNVYLKGKPKVKRLNSNKTGMVQFID